MIYNFTTIGANMSSAGGALTGLSNELLGGWLGVLGLIAIFAITFMGFMSRSGDPGKSILGSSFICFALSMLFRAIGMVGDIVIFVCLLLLAAGLAITWNNR